MIHFNSNLNKWQFNLSNHNLNKEFSKPLIYNQLFVKDEIYLLNTKTGTLYTNTIDLDRVDLLKQYNFHPNSKGRFSTKKKGQAIKIHELIYGVKTNNNWVINHIDGNPSNNKLSNLEIVTCWFNVALMKKPSILPIGVSFNNDKNGYRTAIRMPDSKSLTFSSQDLNYLQNVHYQFGVKSGLVTPERYLQEVPNWLPDSTIEFTPEHQIKLDQLIAAHLENQNRWTEFPLTLIN